MTTSNRLFWNIRTIYSYYAKPNFLDPAHRTIILLVRIFQLFVYCKSTNYFTTGNRLNICLLCIEILYDYFKSPIRKHFNDFYGYCGFQFFGYYASYNYFPTARLPIICLPQIDQLFHHSKSSKYLVTVHWKAVWPLQIANLEIFRRFICLLLKTNFLASAQLSFCYCASQYYLLTANRPIFSPMEIV